MPLRIWKRRAIPPAHPGTDSTAVLLDVPYVEQQQMNWCWASCCEMVFRYYGAHNVRQCDIATAQFGVDCCKSPSDTVCNQAAWPEHVYPVWGFRVVKRINWAISVSKVRAEIDKDRPIEIYFSWHKGSSHVAIIRGYYHNNDLDVHDPKFGSGRYEFSEIVAAYRLGRWTKTYLDLRI